MPIHTVVILAGLTLAGCGSGKPALNMAEPLTQDQMNSTRQWQDHADRIAKKLSDDLVQRADTAAPVRFAVNGTPMIKNLVARDVYVEDDNSEVPQFQRGYRELLTTELTKDGFNVLSEKPKDQNHRVTIIKAKTQVVMMGKQRDGPLGIIPDVVYWLTDTPNCEVLVTTSAESSDSPREPSKFIFRDTSVYYIDDHQSSKYHLDAPPPVSPYTVRTMPLSAK
jgi:hypothetical protein